jgi:phosphinothricin acetyltransferase
MPLDITLATRDDVAHILTVSNWFAEHSSANLATMPEPLEDWLEAYDETHERYPWLVARQDGKFLGFAKAGPYRARGAYAWTCETSVYLVPEAHGHGVGKALYGKLFPLLKAQGYQTLIAGITSPNPPSERLHASFGFQRAALFHHVGYKEGQWHDVSFWELRLVHGEVVPGPVRSVAEIWER